MNMVLSEYFSILQSVCVLKITHISTKHHATEITFHECVNTVVMATQY